MMARLYALFSLWIMLPFFVSAHPIVISDAYIKATSGLNGAAFLTLTNPTKKTIKLVNATVPSATCSHAELHTHVQDEKIYRMYPIQEILLDPETVTVLKPGGFHIMLMNLKEPLKEGTSISLTLEFEGLDPQTLDVPVKKIRQCGCLKNQKVS